MDAPNKFMLEIKGGVMIDQKDKPSGKAARRSPFFVVSIGLMLGALLLQWSNMTAEQQRKREESLFGASACSDTFPPPWRTRHIGNSNELMPSIRGFGLPSCESIEFRPSTCNADHFLVRCYAEDERKGLWRVYRVELENEEIYSVFPDMT